MLAFEVVSKAVERKTIQSRRQNLSDLFPVTDPELELRGGGGGGGDFFECVNPKKILSSIFTRIYIIRGGGAGSPGPLP